LLGIRAELMRESKTVKGEIDARQVEDSYHLQLRIEGGNGECRIRNCDGSSLSRDKTGRLRSRSAVTLEDFITLAVTVGKRLIRMNSLDRANFHSSNQIKSKIQR
jgi:hypothetical protein